MSLPIVSWRQLYNSWVYIVNISEKNVIILAGNVKSVINDTVVTNKLVN